MLLAIVIGAILSLLPFWIAAARRDRYRRLLAVQLRQSLQALVHALRVGAGLLQALDRMAQEAEEPLAGESRRIVQSVRVGMPLTETLSQMRQRVPIAEVQWFVSAVQITQQTGGSLAGILESLADTLQERETLREKVAALTAQGKASGLVLSVLPYVVLAALAVIAPELVGPLFRTWTGQAMLSAVILLDLIGTGVMLRIVSIRVEG